MPGGRSEVFRDSGGEAGCLSEERTSPRPVGGIGQGRAARAVEEREGGASGAESRCRNGAGADGIRVRTSFSPRSPARDGFLTPIRSPAAAESPNCLGVSRKIGVKTTCGLMRPGPTARRDLCGRSGCHPPVRGAPRAPWHTEIPPPAFHPDAILRCARPVPERSSEICSSGGVAPPQPTPTGATPTPTTAIFRRGRSNRRRMAYLRLQNPKR